MEDCVICCPAAALPDQTRLIAVSYPYVCCHWIHDQRYCVPSRRSYCYVFFTWPCYSERGDHAVISFQIVTGSIFQMPSCKLVAQQELAQGYCTFKLGANP